MSQTFFFGIFETQARWLGDLVQPSEVDRRSRKDRLGLGSTDPDAHRGLQIRMEAADAMICLRTSSITWPSGGCWCPAPASTTAYQPVFRSVESTAEILQ